MRIAASLALILCTGCSVLTSLGDWTFGHPDASSPGPDAAALDAAVALDAAAIDAAPEPDSGSADASMGDAGDPCTGGEIFCDGGCIDPVGNRDHCGACGVACAWECGPAGCRDPVHISVGGTHACAVRTDGTAVCWGSNEYGQLGNGTLDPSGIPTPVSDAINLVSVHCGDRHTCALSADGEVSCWGSNSSGEVGTFFAPNPALTPYGALTDAVEVVGGNNLTCARRRSNEVVCWGGTLAGQLGDGTGDTGRAPPGANVTGIDNATRLAATSEGVCAVRSSGGVWCWGSIWEESPSLALRSNVPVELSMFGSVSDFAIGYGHACAVAPSGATSCIGANWVGQLGDGTTEPSVEPVPVAGLVAQEIEANERVSCARTAAGEVFCWGFPRYVGDGTAFNRLVPARVLGIDDAVQIETGSTGSSVVCALRASGDVQCWGSNSFGQLGDPSVDHAVAPVSVLPPE